MNTALKHLKPGEVFAVAEAISLRDHIAMVAMAAILDDSASMDEFRRLQAAGGPRISRSVAILAYIQADSMMDEREVKHAD